MRYICAKPESKTGKISNSVHFTPIVRFSDNMGELSSTLAIVSRISMSALAASVSPQ